MRLYQFAWKNIRRSAFRSWMVGLSALLVAGFALGTTLILRGAEDSLSQAIERLGADIIVVPKGEISSVMVRLEPCSNPEKTALEIMHQVPGVTPIASPNLFRAYHRQLSGLRRAVLVMMGATLGLCLALIGLVSTMAANERCRELGVLPAKGAPQAYVFQTLVTEAGCWH
jgi:hypothetical protein